MQDLLQYGNTIIGKCRISPTSKKSVARVLYVRNLPGLNYFKISIVWSRGKMVYIVFF